MELFHLYVKELSQEKFEISLAPREAGYEIHVKADQSLDAGIRQLHERDPSLKIMTMPDQTAVAYAVGSALFKLLIVAAKPVANAFQYYQTERRKAGRPIRLALHLPASLYHYPWELLHDPAEHPGSFIALNGSIIRYDSATPEKDFEPVDLPFRLWFILSNPTNKPFGGETDINPPAHPEIIFEHIKPATFDQFRQTIRAYDPPIAEGQVRPLVFAFFGHGDISNNVGRLIFVKKAASRILGRWPSDARAGHAINDTIKGCPHLRVVFLCACESAWAGNATTFDNSVAGSLLRGSPSLGYVIGAQTPIDKFSADEFLHQIMHELPRRPLDLAITEARIAVRSMDSTEPDQAFSCFDWWVPVLYARASGFDLVARPDIRRAIEPPARVPSDLIGAKAASKEKTSTLAVLKDVVRRFSDLMTPSNEMKAFRDGQ